MAIVGSILSETTSSVGEGSNGSQWVDLGMDVVDACYRTVDVVDCPW